MEIDVRADPTAPATERTFWNAVTAGYFSAAGIELRSGRLLGLDPRSPATLAGVGVVFLAVGLAATAVPTARAASTDPAEALRSD